MKKTITTVWNETEVLTVTGRYIEEQWSGDRLIPRDPAEFEIHTIEYKGVEVQDLFSDDDHSALADKCLTLIEN